MIENTFIYLFFLNVTIIIVINDQTTVMIKF